MPNAIAGIVYPDIFQVTDLIDKMLSPLKHRAQGSKSYVSCKNFQLGCIGDGFISDSKKTVSLGLDGWIENISTLQELIKQKDLSQEQTLIECYKQFGISFLEKLNGDFAFVLFDHEKEHLYLVRDPIGKKPLYWYHDKSYFFFASELKALLATGIVPQTPAPDSISSYFFFGYIPQDMTPICNVNKLLPAHYLFLSNFHGKQILPYWSYSSYFQKRVHSHKSKIILELNELLEKSVLERIPATGNLGCIVSGGLGSGTIAHFVSRLAKNRDKRAFTASFGEDSEEDLESAELVVNRLHMPQTISEITPDFFIENYAKLAWYLDEPIADLNVLATWKLAESAAQYTKTLYSGMGSDELLAGHSRYSALSLENTSTNPFGFISETFLHQYLIPTLNLFSPKTALHLLKMSRTDKDQFGYLRNEAIIKGKEIKEISPKFATLFDPETFLHKFHHSYRINSHVSSLLYFDVKTRLPDLYILQYERLMTANGIQWQTPFLDRSLIEFAASLPEPEKILESQTASYLKPLIQDVFPLTFINRPKKTRRHFLADWINHPEIANLFYLLKQGTLIETGIISEKWLDQQLINQEQMKMNFPELISVLTLEVWFRLFINDAIRSGAPSIRLDKLLQEN